MEDQVAQPDSVEARAEGLELCFPLSVLASSEYLTSGNACASLPLPALVFSVGKYRVWINI